MKKQSDETIDLSWDENVDDMFSASIKVEVDNVRGDFRHDPSLKQEFFELVRQQETALSR